MAEVNDQTINRFLRLGERGSEIYKPLFDYYEAEIIPQKLSRFLIENKKKSMRKALEAADLTDEELNKYYELGKSGDERFADFYDEFLDIKKGTYVYHIGKGKSHKIAMKESRLTQETSSLKLPCPPSAQRLCTL